MKSDMSKGDAGRGALPTREETIAWLVSNFESRLWRTANDDYQLRLLSRYEVEAVKHALTDPRAGQENKAEAADSGARCPDGQPCMRDYQRHQAQQQLLNAAPSSGSLPNTPGPARSAGTPRADHFRREFAHAKESSILIDWILDELAQEEQRLASAERRVAELEKELLRTLRNEAAFHCLLEGAQRTLIGEWPEHTWIPNLEQATKLAIAMSHGEDKLLEERLAKRPAALAAREEKL